MEYALVFLNPHKCKLIIYHPAREIRPELDLVFLQNKLKKVIICEVNDAINDFGVPLRYK
jgi:hypothetical protein